jgi:integrase
MPHPGHLETSKSRGTYVSPNASRILFGEHARRWMETRNTEAMTIARDRSIIATHILPRRGAVPLGKIDDIALQEWVTELGRRRSRATVSTALQLTAAVLRSAVRNRLIPFNPAEEVRVPGARQLDAGERMISRADLRTRLLPALPERHRAVVAVGAGAGLRWGEAIGLRDDAVELDRA